MKKISFLISGLTLMFLISSCSKEDFSRNKFQGVWKIVKMTQTYYSDTSQNPQPDSVIETKDVGVFMLVDRADYGNILDYNDELFTGRTPTFYDIHGGGWSADYAGNRLSLSAVVYTVKDQPFGRMKLTYIVSPYNGIYRYKEELIISRLNP
ncbi:MAG TPA: hypothetical protein P5050_08055 [Bacteroidia bacterium]|nr:hypothetical protein [Bacteroidia bacterium]HRS59158.1 hypothetical protein [Bacteroidia bacterium]HRU67454.1 hypothetical protein [Bacteroidia bacterium]